MAWFNRRVRPCLIEQSSIRFEVAQWADQLFTTALNNKSMSGVVLTLVQDGHMVLSKGYGYADYASGVPVDPANTRFRVGSITKTFTAMAIAQLLDSGQIASLDDPANKYLKRMQLPAPRGQPGAKRLRWRNC